MWTRWLKSELLRGTLAKKSLKSPVPCLPCSYLHPGSASWSFSTRPPEPPPWPKWTTSSAADPYLRRSFRGRGFQGGLRWRKGGRFLKFLMYWLGIWFELMFVRLFGSGNKKGHHWKYVGTIFQQVKVYKNDLGVLQARQVEITGVLELLI